MVVERFGVYLVQLDPTRAAEMRKTRPCVIVSPDELNSGLHTVIVAPLTTVLRQFPFRVTTRFAGKRGQSALDQIRVVDKARLVKSIGKIDRFTAANVLKALQELFA